MEFMYLAKFSKYLGEALNEQVKNENYSLVKIKLKIIFDGCH